MRRLDACVLFVAALAAVVWVSGSSSELVVPSSSQPAADQVASRWYHRARHGQLHSRSSGGRSYIGHTVRPVSAR